jgi:hypothetical protein
VTPYVTTHASTGSSARGIDVYQLHVTRGKRKVRRNGESRPEGSGGRTDGATPPEQSCASSRDSGQRTLSNAWAPTCIGRREGSCPPRSGSRWSQVLVQPRDDPPLAGALRRTRAKPQAAPTADTTRAVRALEQRTVGFFDRTYRSSIPSSPLGGSQKSSLKVNQCLTRLLDSWARTLLASPVIAFRQAFRSLGAVGSPSHQQRSSLDSAAL